MSKYLFIIIILFGSNPSFAQQSKVALSQKLMHLLTSSKNIEKEDNKNGEHQFKVDYGNAKHFIKSTKNASQLNNEVQFYLNIVKRNGWLEGVGKPLTKDEICHVPLYFKLSGKNKAGKWTVVQAYNAYGNLTTSHAIGTYIVNQQDEYDTGANAEWVEKLKTVCQWEFISDNTGKEVIQERGLDSDNNIIFCYNPVKVKKNVYGGSYSDAFGMPIFMRTDSTGNYKGQSNFVQIKRDDRGYEVLYSFTDEEGRPQLNKDGAYMTSKGYDNDGQQTREASLNIVGDQMIDYYGNCGWSSIADNYGNQIRSIYFDENNKIIKMPGTRGSNKVYGYEFAYDKYHRETDRWYLDSLGQRCVNEFGVYNQKLEYNSHGERTSSRTYDINGKLIAGDTLGIAQVITEYDDKGNLLNLEWQDANEQLINGYGDYCKRVMKYDKSGNNIYQVDFAQNDNDSTIVNFKYESDGKGNELRIWYDKGYCRIDSVDVKGRGTLEAWYDLEGKPFANPNDEAAAWHKHVTEYDDINNTETEYWFDTDSTYYVNTEYSLSNKFNKGITVKDTSKNILTNYQYLEKVGLAQSFQKQFDDNFDDIIAQWDITPYGEHARVGWWNNLHYTCKVDYTMYGKMRLMKGVNEFDEPSYLVSLNDNGEVYYFNDMGNYYDEFGRIIPSDSMQTFKERLPKAFCVEVTDTTVAYPLGLRNGDIILSYGDWRTTEDLRSNLNYFYLETILKNKQPKDITILRHDLSSKTSSLYRYSLPEGKPSDLGFYPHQICYTQKEAARLHTACFKDNFQYGKTDIIGDKQVLMGVQLKGGLIQTRFYHFPMYDFKDPGFLLYAKEKYSKGCDVWTIVTDSVPSWYKKEMFGTKFSGKTELLLTQDFANIKKLSKSSKGNRGLRIVPIYVSNDIYNKILDCCPDTIKERKIIDELANGILDSAPSFPKIKAKNLVGNWATTLSEDNISIEISMLLDQKHNAKTITTLNVIGEISEGVTLKLQASIIASGMWSLNNILQINYKDETKQVSVDGFDIIGVSEEQKQQYIDEFNQHKSELVELFIGNDSSKFLPANININRIDKKQMEVTVDGDTNMTFTKQK